jgi:hypothetical protein
MRFWDARRWADENVQALVAEPVVLVNDAVREPAAIVNHLYRP